MKTIDMKRDMKRMAIKSWEVLRRPRVLFPLLFVVGAGAGLAWGSWHNLCVDCPSIAEIQTWEPEQASKLLSFDGREIANLGVRRRTPVSIHALPEYVPQAFVAVEDKRFYRHRGVDPLGLTRAVVGLLTGRSGQMGGGSTITQQLARNIWEERIGFERRDFWKLVMRKLKEMKVALQLEEAYTKDQILEAYINQVYYGGGHGIQTASRQYFGKDAVDLNPAEGALLAAIINNVGRYHPIRQPENARNRRNLVLRRMVAEGFLTEEEGAMWSEHPLPDGNVTTTVGLAPYFEEWVRQIVDSRFGSKVYSSGLRIYTTLDIDMQRAALDAMEAGWERAETSAQFNHPLYADTQDQEEDFPNGETPYLQGAFIAVDPLTGHVKAMIGGRDFNQSKFDRVRQAERQAGSVFKPFVYTAAISVGIPASHIVLDAPVVLPQVSGEDWRPGNFNPEFRGPITMREGLRKSINMIAIRLGVEEVGLETVAQTAERMGIRTEVERFPSTTIGAVEVVPIQLVEAYSAFPTLGTKVRPHPILRVESADGEILWEPQPDRQVVLDSLPARIMVDMLQDVVDAGAPDPGTAYNGVRNVGRLPFEVPAGGKTGTTNDGTDTWFMGFTPNLVAGVWFGFDRPAPIYRASAGNTVATGGGLAAPVWGEFMRRVYYGDDTPPVQADSIDGEAAPRYGPLLEIPQPWTIPPGLTTREVDSKTGMLASRWCPSERRYREFYIPGTEPTEYCDDSGRVIFDRFRDD